MIKFILLALSVMVFSSGCASLRPTPPPLLSCPKPPQLPVPVVIAIAITLIMIGVAGRLIEQPKKDAP